MGFLGCGNRRKIQVRMQSQCQIVAATNGDLADMVTQGDFRQDLYYRLRVGSFSIYHGNCLRILSFTCCISRSNSRILISCATLFSEFLPFPAKKTSLTKLNPLTKRVDITYPPLPRHDGSHGNHIGNIFSTTSSRKIVDRLCETLHNRTNSFRTSQTFG